MRLTLAFFVAVVVALVVACSGGNDDAALERAAIQAMTDLNAADETFPTQFTKELAGLTGILIMGTDGAADTIKVKLLPLIDGYLATIDKAVALADKYMATKQDEKTKAGVDAIRKRAEAFHKARERFVELEQKARAGATADEINSGIMGIGLMLSVGK